MVIWPVVLASLAAGWIGASGLGTRGLERVFMTLPTGAGLWLACDFLLSRVMPPVAAALMGSVIALGMALWLQRVSRPPALRARLRWHLWLLLVVASVAAWMSIVGGCQLVPPRELLLFEMPFIAAGGAGPHPLGPEALTGVTPFAAAAAALGGDPWRTTLVLGGIAQAGMVASWLLLLGAWNRTASLAPALAGLALLLGSHEGWLVGDLPSVAAAHLLAVLSLWFWSCRGALAVAPLVLGLLTVSPHLALAIAVATLVRLPRHPAVLFLALLSGLWQGGLSLSLLAALTLWWAHPKKTVRALAAVEFLYPGLFGLAALGMALGRTARVVWLRFPGERLRLDLQPELALQVPRRLIVALATLLALWLALAPGEEVFNDRILISAQKQKVRFEHLLIPERLADWARWRGASLGLAPADLEAVRVLERLEGPALYLSGAPQERVEVAALVSSLAGGRPLAGWYVGHDGAGLLPAAAATASTGRDDLLGATPVRWLLRQDAEPLPLKPASVGSRERGAVRHIRAERWSTLQQYWSDQGASYEVTRDGRAFGADFGVALGSAGLIPLQLPDLPGRYQVLWASGARDTYSVPAALPLEGALEIDPEVPSRSLLPVTVTLTNVSGVDLKLDDVRGARLALRSLTGEPDRPAPITPQREVLLGPGQARTLTVHLRTPPDPDIVEARLELLDSQGVAHAVPITPAVLRCWTRRPPLAVPDGVVRPQ